MPLMICRNRIQITICVRRLREEFKISPVVTQVKDKKLGGVKEVESEER